MSVLTGSMPMCLRKLRKLAIGATLVHASTQAAEVDYCKVPDARVGLGGIRTIGGFVHDDESSINLGAMLSMLKIHRVGVTSEPVGSLEEMDIMRASVQSP